MTITHFIRKLRNEYGTRESCQAYCKTYNSLMWYNYCPTINLASTPIPDVEWRWISYLLCWIVLRFIIIILLQPQGNELRVDSEGSFKDKCFLLVIVTKQFMIILRKKRGIIYTIELHFMSRRNVLDLTCILESGFPKMV